MKRKRIPRPARCPTMVAMTLAPEVGITERMSINAISQGWATTYHFDVLADCRDLLSLAGEHKRDQSAIDMCDLAGIALMNIKDRYLAKGKIGAAGDELKALTAFADNADVYLTSTAGSVDDTDVAGDFVSNAKGASALDAPATGMAEFEIQYPYMDDGSSA